MLSNGIIFHVTIHKSCPIVNNYPTGTVPPVPPSGATGTVPPAPSGLSDMCYTLLSSPAAAGERRAYQQVSREMNPGRKQKGLKRKILDE
jgi:hypothetical protein